MPHVLEAARRSRALHRGFVAPPGTPEQYRAYLDRIAGSAYIGHLLCLPDGEPVGVVNINEIVRGSFCSGYLGYHAFVPHNGRGYMTRGLQLVLRRAFGAYRLHRLEANIQPANLSSISLVRRLGFRLEGFSPRYLKIAGRWRDHERWALTAEEWRSNQSPAHP